MADKENVDPRDNIRKQLKDKYDVPEYSQQYEHTGGKFFNCTNCRVTFEDLQTFNGHCRINPQCSMKTLKEVSDKRENSYTQPSYILLLPGDIVEGQLVDLPSNAICLPEIRSAIINPTLVSDSPRNTTSIINPTIVPIRPCNTTSLPVIRSAIINPILISDRPRNTTSLPVIRSAIINPTLVSIRPRNIISLPVIRSAIINPTEETVSNINDDHLFECPHCQSCFEGQEDLKVHIRTHIVKKRYQCGACGRDFGDRSSLNRHMRIHTGEKPYPCKVCWRKFARADYLSKHITTHIGIPFARLFHSLH